MDDTSPLSDANPPLDELADADDTLGWDREEHGRMSDHAAPDHAIVAEPYLPAPEVLA